MIQDRKQRKKICLLMMVLPFKFAPVGVRCRLLRDGGGGQSLRDV